MQIRLTTVYFTLLSLNAAAGAQLRLPAIFSDHMVLQAGVPVPVWGMATPGTPVAVAFGSQTLHTTADNAGYWQVRLAQLTASDQPAEMTVLEEPASAPPSSMTIHDVLVGEVWIAGGQSNMAFGLNSMEGREPIIAAASNPQLRLFDVKHNAAPEPLGLHPGQIPGDVLGKWEVSDPKSAAAFSAVAYLCGSELQRTLHRPVGMISSNWGGTPIQTWISREGFASEPAFAKYLDDYARNLTLHKQLAADPANDTKYKEDWRLWRKEVGDKLDANMKIWNAVQAAGKDPGPKPKASRPEPQNPDPTGIPLGGFRPNAPAISWNAMFAPVVPFAMHGALWYQGEANVSHYKEYGPLLSTMVQDWRRAFANSSMDFLVVQLPANGPNDNKRELAHQREAQATILSLPHTGLAITFDVGDPGNVHPASKIDVGHRLALIALGEAYGQKIPYTGPVFQSAKPQGNSMRVTFTNIAGKLTIAQTPWLSVHTVPFPTDKLIGFEIAGDDKVFHAADATIESPSVILTAPGVAKPHYVRYAFDESPRANLYDSAGLPTAPFRNDTDK